MLGRHALEYLAVLEPELHAVGDALVGDEMRAVLPPRRTSRPAGSMRSMIFCCGSACLQQLAHVARLQAIALGDVADEGLDVRALEVKVARARCGVSAG